jgi:integrase
MRKSNIFAVEEGIQSDISKKIYRWHFDTFLKHTGLTDERLYQVAKKDPRKIESIIIEYLRDHMFKEKNLKHVTINLAMSAIFHFFDMNDIMNINKRKISKFIPADENHEKDRDYTEKEIQKLLNGAEERLKVTILLMASTGMRPGAIPGLELRDLTEFPPKDSGIGWPNTDDYPKPYKIEVYARSKKDGYYTFCTPECARAINDYLDLRERSGEDINKKDSPLIREQFNVNSKSDATNPKKVNLPALNKLIERTVKKAGIKNALDQSSPRVMRSNGFRKFVITRMRKAKVDYDVREYLVGHRLTRGLGVNYDRTSEEDRFEEWTKAINLLTINEEFQVKKELQRLKDEQERRLFEQDQKIAKLSETLKSVLDERDSERNKTAKAIKWALHARHSNVKSGNWTESEAMDFLNNMLNEVDPIDKKHHKTTSST